MIRTSSKSGRPSLSFNGRGQEGEDYQSVTAVLATKKIAIADDIIRGGAGLVLKCDQAHQI